MSERDAVDKNERPSTYVVQDRKSEDELARLLIQDQLFTEAMGGPLAEQENPASLRRVLDVACGPAGWIMEAARLYPELSLFGIDISHTMIEYGRARAEALYVNDRVELHTMDALLMLEFPVGYFDLVNMRFGVSFLRTWDWQKMIGEMVRVTRGGGVIRLTESGTFGSFQNATPALKRFGEIFEEPFYKAGYFFESVPDGFTVPLADLLTRYGRIQSVQQRITTVTYRPGSPETRAMSENMQYLFKTIKPFIQKWGKLPDDYDEVCQAALAELRDPNFSGTQTLLTAWGTVPAKKLKLHTR